MVKMARKNGKCRQHCASFFRVKKILHENAFCQSSPIEQKVKEFKLDGRVVFENSCTFLNFAANQTVMIALMALQLSAARVLMNVVHLNGRSLS